MARFTPESSRKRPDSIGEVRGGFNNPTIKSIIVAIQLAGILLMTRVAMFSMGVPFIGIPIVDSIAITILKFVKYNLPNNLR